VSTLIPQAYQLPAIAFLLIGGIIAWSAGYRLFRLVLTIYGFILGALVGSSMLGASDTTLLIFGSIGGGALGALIMFFGYFVGVALVGAGLGALAVHMVWNRLGSDPHPFVVILAAVAGAAAAMVLQRYVIIVSTAFAGAWTMIFGGVTLLDRTGKLARARDVWIVYPLDPSPGQRWTIGAWAALGLLGVLIQLRFTGRTLARGPSKVQTKK
jgi:hypothetical protein